MWREGTGNTSKPWEGVCPTASGRRPSVQVTDPPYKLMERKNGSGPSLFCSLERLPDLPEVTRWHPTGQVCTRARVTLSRANPTWTSYFSWARTCDLCLPLGLVRPLKGHSRPGIWPHPPGAGPGHRVPSVVGMGWGPPRGGEVGPQLTQGPPACSTRATQPPARLSGKQASHVEARVPASLQEKHRLSPLACPPLSVTQLSNAGPSRKLVGLARKNSSRA